MGRHPRGPDETGSDGQGMYRYVDGGKRYRTGQWPQRNPKAFDNAGTVVIYNDVPPKRKRTPTYPHQPHQLKGALMRKLLLVLTIATAMVLSTQSAAVAVPTPPTQPASGPGGAGYQWSS